MDKDRSEFSSGIGATLYCFRHTNPNFIFLQFAINKPSIKFGIMQTTIAHDIFCVCIYRKFYYAHHHKNTISP
jgi:hypothetical protein